MREKIIRLITLHHGSGDVVLWGAASILCHRVLTARSGEVSNWSA